MSPAHPATSVDDARHQADEILAAFAVALRSAGVAVTPDRTATFLRGCAVSGADDRASVYWTGRATLCGSIDDLDRYDQVFTAWFSGTPLRPASAREPSPHAPRTGPSDSWPPGADGAPTGTVADAGLGHSPERDHVRAAASDTEVLRHRDIASLSLAERAEVARLFDRLRPSPPLRLSPRRGPAPRGEVDGRRTLRAQVRGGGEPARLSFRRRTCSPRRVVVIVDVSGSMRPYADSLLRFAHVVATANRNHTEVFTIGTRLTRVTRAMRLRDGESALEAAGSTVPDWSGGTRLGEALRVFVDRHGRRGMARGAVVVVLSDGWERGDSSRLAEQMRRLHRLAHTVVWVNPHQGKPGYAPVQSGIVAVLPFVDHFLAGHSMATFEDALKVIARA